MTDCLKDPLLDAAHHALGRPAGPHVTPYRNRYCTGRTTAKAEAMRASPFWREAGTLNEGRDSWFMVTEEGVAAVWRALAEANKASGLRAYSVTGIELGPRVVMAKSRAAARYDVFLDLSDVWSITFAEFIRRFEPRAVVARIAPPPVAIPF